MTLTISVFENSENLLKNGIYCEKRQKLQKMLVTNFDPLLLKNFDSKKSEKIQGNSWDGYEAI